MKPAKDEENDHTNSVEDNPETSHVTVYDFSDSVTFNKVSSIDERRLISVLDGQCYHKVRIQGEWGDQTLNHYDIWWKGLTIPENMREHLDYNLNKLMHAVETHFEVPGGDILSIAMGNLELWPAYFDVVRLNGVDVEWDVWQAHAWFVNNDTCPPKCLDGYSAKERLDRKNGIHWNDCSDY